MHFIVKRKSIFVFMIDDQIVSNQFPVNQLPAPSTFNHFTWSSSAVGKLSFKHSQSFLFILSTFYSHFTFILVANLLMRTVGNGWKLQNRPVCGVERSTVHELMDADRNPQIRVMWVRGWGFRGHHLWGREQWSGQTLSAPCLGLHLYINQSLWAASVGSRDSFCFYLGVESWVIIIFNRL